MTSHKRVVRIIFNFLINLPLDVSQDQNLGQKNRGPKYSHIVTQTKRFDETNLMVYVKNNLEVNRVTIWHFFTKNATTPPIEDFENRI